MNIEQTISLYLDGELSSEQEAEFHHLLSVSPEARSLFREHMKLQSIARDEQTLLTPEPELRNSLFSRLQGEGMSLSLFPGSPGDPLIDEEEPSIPAESHYRMTEQVRHRRSMAPAALVADREPLPNQQRDEEKRRRRLIPILIPTLLLAVAGSILWLDSRDRFSGGEDRTIATADVRGVEERSEGENATDQGMIDRGITRSTPAEDAPAQVEAGNSAAPSPTAAAPRYSARSAAASARSPEENRQPVVQPQERSSRQSDVLNPSVNTFAHSIPPDENLGGFSAPENLDDLQVNSSLSLGMGALGMGDDAMERNGADAPDDMAYAEDTELDEYQSSVAPSTPQRRLGAARDRMNTSVPQQMADSVSADAAAASLPDPTFAVTDSPSDSRMRERSVVSVFGHDEDGESITPLLENRDEILASLRERGIFIGHDGTFSFTPPAEVDSMAVSVLSSIRFDPDNQSPPAVVYQATADEKMAPDLKETEARDVASAAEPAGPKQNPLDAEEDRTSGFRPFLAIEGSLVGPVSSSSRSISWVYDDPVTQTSSVKGEILLKGGPGGFLFLVAGLAPYEERSVTYNALAMGPVPPISENVVRDRREFWAGVGGRYIVRLTGSLATGLEGIVGAGQKRFHAGISIPVSWSLTEKFAVEFIPHVRYRNAHAPLRPTTGTDSGYETIQGPAADQELSVGTGIGLILLLY